MTDLETRRTEWIAYGHFGFSHYRIWMRKTAHGMFQRHEWRRDDGTEDMDDWIPSPCTFGEKMVPA